MIIKKVLVNFLCCFIPVKKIRKQVRKKFLKRNKVYEEEKKVSSGFVSAQAFIDDNVEVGEYSYICPGSRVFFNTRIGKFCSIATDVTIGASLHPLNFLSTHPFQYSSFYMGNEVNIGFNTFPETIIENDVWIGCHAVIKCGVRIGTGAVIGSGAVVTKDVPPYAVMVGIPAKILKYRFNEETIRRLLKTEWWNLPKEKLEKLPFSEIEECLKILESGE